MWRTRIIRRVLSLAVRTPLRKNFLRLINFSIPVPDNAGCVIAVCHTPWKRILVQWCLENKFGLIIAGGNWTHRKKIIQRHGTGYTDLRNLVKFLQNKGHIILAADVFNQKTDCPVSFLGNSCNASMVPARLAHAAGVPLVGVVPQLTGKSINFLVGPAIAPERLSLPDNQAIEQLLAFFEREIERDPSIWPSYVL